MFGYAKDLYSPVQPCTPELFYNTLDSPLVAEVCRQLRELLEKFKAGDTTDKAWQDNYNKEKGKLKRKLPVFTPHAIYKSGRRCNDEAILSGLSIYDKDHIENPRGYWDEKRQWLEAHHPDVLERIVLVHVTPSSEGLRLFFVVPDGMDLASAQEWMSNQLADKTYDGSVKDKARNSFAVPRSYVIYLNEEELFKERKVKVIIENNKNNGKQKRTKLPDDAHRDSDGRGVDNRQLAKALAVFDLCCKEAGLNVDTLDTNVGARHTSLICIMSKGAARMMSQQEMTYAVATRMPGYAEEPDCPKLIEDFYENYVDTSRPFTQEMIRINAMAEQMLSGEGAKAEPTAKGDEVQADEFEAEPPKMPEKLPRLIELLVSRTPEEYKAAVACAVFPPLATHLWKTSFKYIDNVEHEATLMCCLMAGTGAGKSCVSEPIRHIMADIKERDKVNLAREKEWKDANNRKGANKEGQKRPDDLIIQEIDADMTNPAFVMRTAEAQGHFLYTSLNELDQFDALRGTGKQQFRIMCLAFDPHNEYGQTRVGSQSVTERVTVRFNWNASTTIMKGKQYFGKVLTDGPVSRINFCTIPERPIGAEMPVYGTYNESFDIALQPYIDHLRCATGLVECKEAYDLALQMKSENAKKAEIYQDRVFENLSFRANVIAYLKACVLYVANGGRWEPEMESFIRWSEEYDLWCKMHFFGEAIERASNEGVNSNKRGRRNMLRLLPDIFTEKDVENIRVAEGLDKIGANQQIRQWLYRNYIQRNNNNSNNFEKLKYRHDGLELAQ